MSTPPVSSSSIYQELQAYLQQRGTDVQQLGKDLSSGNLANAQQDLNALQTLGQSGPSANGDVFESSQREQDLTAVGQALQAGNLSAAQQALAQLESTYHHHANSASASTSTSSSSGSIYQQLQAYYQQRSADVKQLGQDLTAGNITNAEQDYNAIQTLGQSGPFKSGGAFNNNQREQALNAIGQALQSGDLAGAQQAFAQLEATYQKHQTTPPVFGPPQTSPPVFAPPSSSGTGASTGSSSGTSAPASGAGTEIILNLANASAGEQITIGLTNEGNGTEQVTISAANPQNQTPEQVILNVNPNLNQQIFLNLFGNSAGSSTQGSSLNTTA